MMRLKLITITAYAYVNKKDAIVQKHLGTLFVQDCDLIDCWLIYIFRENEGP